MIDLEATIARMRASGMDADTILLALSCLKIGGPVVVHDEAADRRRAADRERKRLRKSAEFVGNDDVSEKEASPAPLEEKTEPPKENTPLRGVQKKRGHRLPSDFTLPDEWRDWAIDRALPAARVPVEFEKLCNWAANAGSKGVKTDWFRAWQNWVIAAIDALPQNRAPPALRTVAPSQADVFALIGKRLENGQEREDRSSIREAVSHLPAVRTG